MGYVHSLLLNDNNNDIDDVLNFKDIETPPSSPRAHGSENSSADQTGEIESTSATTNLDSSGRTATIGGGEDAVRVQTLKKTATPAAASASAAAAGKASSFFHHHEDFEDVKQDFPFSVLTRGDYDIEAPRMKTVKTRAYAAKRVVYFQKKKDDSSHGRSRRISMTSKDSDSRIVSCLKYIMNLIFSPLITVVNILLHFVKMIFVLVSCYSGKKETTRQKLMHLATTFCLLLGVLYGCFYMFRLKNFSTELLHWPDLLLLGARITGKWFTVSSFIAYFTSFRTVTSELSRANAVSRLGIAWRDLHKFLMKQAFLAAVIHAAIHEVRKYYYSVAPFNPFWFFERVTGYLLILCFISQSSQGMIHYLNKKSWGKTCLNYRQKIMFELKVWFRHTHHRVIHISFVVLVFLHTMNQWMIIAALLWYLDYWLHSVEIEKIWIVADDRHVTLKFKPKRMSDFPPEFGNYVQLSYKSYSASYTAVTENDGVVVKMSKDCVMANVLKDDHHIEDNGEVNKFFIRNFNINGPYRSNPSVVNLADPLLVFTSGVGRTVATSAVEYYSFNRTKRVVVVCLSGRSRPELPSASESDAAPPHATTTTTTTTIATDLQNSSLIVDNTGGGCADDNSGMKSRRSTKPTRTTKPKRKLYEYDDAKDLSAKINEVDESGNNITMFDIYGTFDTAIIRNLFKDILLSNPQSLILLCGKQIVDLYAPRVATKEWEERVIIEDFE
jgi:NAD(P)H-flavin reductase